MKNALDPVHEQVGDKLLVEGPDVRLRPRIATMLSLAMHELGENAIMHGSLGRSKGTVDVRWSISEGHLRLAWHEQGGPEVRVPNSKGYGVTIVERVLAAEFGGTAKIEYARGGIVFMLDAPSEGLDAERTEWAAP